MAGADYENLSDDEIDVTPTRTLFVEMLTRDIQLDRAVLDLVDNSIDGAKRLRPLPDQDFEGLEIKIVLDGDRFEIHDNCGGIGIDTARHYAFRFGRAKGMTATPGSVGQFGVGMKRALFKFGHNFEVISQTVEDRFELRVDVDAWEQEDGPWRFSFDDSGTGLNAPIEETGTHIVVTPLRHDARAQFGSTTFRNSLGRQIETAQQQYIDRKLRIVFDGKTLLATPWQLVRGQATTRLAPAEKPESIIKTEVYRLVNKLNSSRYRTDFQSVLLHKMEELTPRIGFDSNPYYWALKAISVDGEVAVKANVISKYARQLAYASRHRIPAELLVGFLYQVGGIGRISKRLNDGSYEPWHKATLPWLNPR